MCHEETPNQEERPVLPDDRLDISPAVLAFEGFQLLVDEIRQVHPQRLLNLITTPVVRTLEEVRNGLRAIAESPEVRQAVLDYQNLLDLIRRIDAQQLVSAIGEALQAAKDTLEKADLLGELGWTFPVYMSPWRLYKILELNDPELIDAAFVDFYNESDGTEYQRLRNAMMTNERLTYWSPLLTQCLDAYDRDTFLIVVPSLLTILEGVIAKPENVRFVRTKDRVKFFEEKISATDDEYDQSMWRSATSFVKTLFSGHDFGGPEPPQLNRHWILHGRDLPDWGRADCLRLLQGIGMVSQLE